MQVAEKANEVKVVERELAVNNIIIHIKSVFTEQTTLDSAVKNIITRKLSERKN